jgi:phosphate transport system substrate-binding protein
VKRTSRWAIAPAAAVLALSLAACGGDAEGDGVTGTVVVDGSSTVEPMSNAAKELLTEENPKVKISVSAAGTGGGFERFCVGETDISDASRPIEQEEIDVCEENGIEYTELQVATDALTVVVHPDLDVTCLTVDQLIALWEPGSKVDNWQDLDPSFPNEDIALFGPGADSGTYDYMAGDVIGAESETTRDDYEASEDDNTLVQGVANTEGATAYFGYTYYEENTDSLKALEIDNGSGCVAPSAETAQAGEYTPLARPLFIYVNNAKYENNEAVKAYVDYYIEQLSTIAEAAQFIPLSEELYAETQSRLEGLA